MQLRLLAKFRMSFLELYRLLKEVFGHRDEKPGGIGRPVLAEQRRADDGEDLH